MNCGAGADRISQNSYTSDRQSQAPVGLLPAIRRLSLLLLLLLLLRRRVELSATVSLGPTPLSIVGTKRRATELIEQVLL